MIIVPAVTRSVESADRDTDRHHMWKVALHRLRSDWRRHGPVPAPALPAYVGEVPPDDRSEAMQDLIAEHMRLAWQLGRGPLIEAYLEAFRDEFPGWTSPSSVPAELVEDEFLARFAVPHGDAPGLEEYAGRFAGRPDIIELLGKRSLAAGRYITIEPRGRGGMGEIWEAHDRRWMRRVAVKRLSEQSRRDPAARARLAREAELTATLEHPGIATVYDVLPDDPVAGPCLVLRLVRGRSLGREIRDFHSRPANRTRGDDRLLWDRILRSIVAACDAVAYAHARGVLHCDLKPDNILQGEFGETIVLDWGLGGPPAAAACDGEPAVAGTPEFMAPEQANGVADARSDVYGLGAVLFEALVNRAPRGWASERRPADWRDEVRNREVPSPRRVNRRVPRGLDSICSKALARRPRDRYESAAALGEDLRRYLARAPRRGAGLRGVLGW